MATASASATSCGEGTASRPRRSFDHRLHLLLLGAAVADHRALDLRRAVLDDRNRRLRRGEQRDAAGVPQLQRAAHVLREEDVLDRHALRAVTLEQRLQTGVNREEPFRKCRAGGRGQDAAGDEAVTAARRFDAAVAGAFRAGIDPENSISYRGASPRRSPLHTRSRGPCPTPRVWLARAACSQARLAKCRVTRATPRSPSLRCRRSTRPSWCLRAPRWRPSA